MQIDAWLKHAQRDAIHKDLPKLVPLLDMLLSATQSLRANHWLKLSSKNNVPVGHVETPLTGSPDAPSTEQK